jgi:hypothetical protein
MSHHGKGPKDVRVGAYARWQNGRRRQVESHLRGWAHDSLRKSPLQLDFGF